MNIFDFPKPPWPEELTTVLAESGHVRIERIVSAGHVSGWYDQADFEFVALLEGCAEIEFENGKTVRLSKGGTLSIQPHERHKVIFTSSRPPCVWLCVFY